VRAGTFEPPDGEDGTLLARGIDVAAAVDAAKGRWA
jgi:hypothetical protein